MRELEIRPEKTAITWALGAFFINVFVIYILYLIGIGKDSPVNYLSYLPFVLGIFLCIRYHKMKDLGGYISFWRAFGTGFRFVSIFAFLMGIFMFIYLKWLNHAVFEQGILQAKKQMINEGSSDIKIKKALDMARSWGPLIAAFTSAFMYTLTGTILSFVLAALQKKDDPMFAPVEEEN